MRKFAVILIALVLISTLSAAPAEEWEDHSRVCPNCRRETVFKFNGKYMPDPIRHYAIYYCTLPDCLWTDCYDEEFALHKGGTATCTEPGACTVCNEPYIKPLGHYFGEWTSNGDGTHIAFCRRCNISANRACDCEDGDVCPVCGSGEYALIKEATATGKTYPERGELCVMYSPDRGFIITWEYYGETVPITMTLTVAIPVEIDGDFTIEYPVYTYANGVLTLTIDKETAFAILR